MAQVDYFIELDGIEGESQDSQFAKHIEVLSWSWGETNDGTHGRGGGGGAGKVSMQDFVVVTNYNKASPEVMLRCATGTHIPSATLHCRRAGGGQEVYLKITMNDLIITSVSTGGSGGDVVPVDQFSMNFAKIAYEYKPQKADGSHDAPIKTGYDIRKNQKI